MRQVTRYSAELKENLIAKALAPNGPSIVELAKEFNIPYATFHTWMHTMRKTHSTKPTITSQRPKDKSAEEKLQAVIDTMNKNDIELGEYCRQQGIYSHHLAEWRKQMLSGLGAPQPNPFKAKCNQAEHELKQLKRELHRKDKALAEVSALLVLKKKADLLWGVKEED